MNLNKMFVFIFVFIGLFAALLATMPVQFVSLGITSSVQDKEAADYFTAQNVTMYNYTASFNLTRGVSHKETYGLIGGQQLEFWWDTKPRYGYVTFELRHLTDYFPVFDWWYGQHNLAVQEPYRSQMKAPQFPNWLEQEDVVTNLFDEDINATYCDFACEHISVKVFILPYNESWTMQESWNNGLLHIYISYDIDYEASAQSMLNVIWQIVSFQNPDLGIPGTGGFILNTGIGLSLWASMALLIFAFWTSVVPFIRGWVGGGGD